MKIKIKALADIEFLSAKVDRKHNGLIDTLVTC